MKSLSVRCFHDKRETFKATFNMNDNRNSSIADPFKLPKIHVKQICSLKSSSMEKLVNQRLQRPDKDLTPPTSRSASVASDRTGRLDFGLTAGTEELILAKLPISKPSSMRRAKIWSLDVENAFRYQLAGYTDKFDYYSIHGSPTCWSDSMMINFLIVKLSGYFMYFRNARECEDKHLNKVKLYTY